jgi:hypothetical protein
MNLKTICRLALIAALSVCASCASHDHASSQPKLPDPPEPTKGVSSYAPDKFRVIYDGTRWTKPQKAADFAMLRAADTTLQHGYGYFIVLNENDAMHSRSWSSPGFASTQYYQNGMASTTFSGGGENSISWPYITLLIQTFTNNVDGSLDAAYLKQSLFKQYNLDSTP